MRLVSVTLHNYRVHRDLKIDFDPSRALIGGPNEAGKSTLIEAVHRALFLRAKGNTEFHRRMVPTEGGNPEVQLVFEQGGRRFSLRKRFGTGGTVSLVPDQGAPLSGEEAEEELSRLLGVDPGLTGKGAVLQWAHLWVWQGSAGEEPLCHATAHRDGLLRRLQDLGGAAVLQSELDAAVAAAFSEQRGRILTEGGKPRAGSDLERAAHDLAGARGALEQAVARVLRLEASADDLESAAKELKTLENGSAALDLEEAAIEARAGRLAELRRLEAEQSHAFQAAADREQAVRRAHDQVAGIQSELAGAERELQPQARAIAELEGSETDARQASRDAEARWQAAMEAHRRARQRHDLAVVHRNRFERCNRLDALQAKGRQVHELREQAASLGSELARTAKVDKTGLDKLRRLETAWSNARAALQAMATGVEVAAADAPVTIGGLPAPVGERRILTEETEVLIGSVAHLRLLPGGGTSLADARTEETKAQAACAKMLDSLTVRDVGEAVEAATRRLDLDAQLKANAARREGLGAEELEKELAEAQARLAEADADVARLNVLVPEVTAPVDETDAAALEKQSKREMRDSEDQDAAAATDQDRLRRAHEAAVERLEGTRRNLRQLERRRDELRSQLELLIKAHGDDDARSRAVVEAAEALRAAEAILGETRQTIASLQPELLEKDRARIKRAREQNAQERLGRKERLAAARANLALDGSVDPLAERSAATARVRSGEEHYARWQRHARALDLLHRLFTDEQHTLAEQYTRPLAEKISGYLRCLFGADARVEVELRGNDFEGLRLVRPGPGQGSFSFDTLSGGTREQAAVAVRLAMAEILAADQDGCLPVVLDDAFAYSDPDRIAQLQRMLDLGADRGLQIIVLTCNPGDYASLGARQTILRPAPASAPPVGPASDVAAPAEGLVPAGAPPAVSSAPDASLDDRSRTFLNLLRARGGKAANATLLAGLGWDQVAYDTVKDALKAAGMIETGRGRGGSVLLAGLED